MHFVKKIEEYSLHKTVWCEVGLKLVDTETNNFKEDELNHIFVYAVFIIDD